MHLPKQQCAVCSGVSLSRSNTNEMSAAFSETLAVEVAQFSIRVLLVEPGGFQTNWTTTTPLYTGNMIPDYDAMRKRVSGFYEVAMDNQKGDPAKAMELLTDVVKAEGKAAGRPWPFYLPLGSTADASIRGKCVQLLSLVEKWEDLTTNLDFDAA